MKKRWKTWYTWLSAITICLLIVAAVIVKQSQSTILTPMDGEIFAKKGNGLYISQLQLTDRSGNQAGDEMPAIVYRGRIYVHSNDKTLRMTSIDLKGDLLGTVKNGLTGWEMADREGVGPMSNFGSCSLYTLKGYDKRYRLMTIDENTSEAVIFECLNNIWLEKGNDLFSVMKVKDRIIKAELQSLDDWNTSGDRKTELLLDDKLSFFLYNVGNSDFVDYGRDTTPHLYEVNRTVLCLTLEDGILIELYLFDNGYIGVEGVSPYVVLDVGKDCVNQFLNQK